MHPIANDDVYIISHHLPFCFDLAPADGSVTFYGCVAWKPHHRHFTGWHLIQLRMFTCHLPAWYDFAETWCCSTPFTNHHLPVTDLNEFFNRGSAYFKWIYLIGFGLQIRVAHRGNPFDVITPPVEYFFKSYGVCGFQIGATQLL